MNIYDIEECFKKLSLNDRKFILGALTPLMQNVVSSGRLEISDIPDYLEHFSFKTNDLDINKLISNYKKENYLSIEERFTQIQNAIQGLENFFIFFEASSNVYILRSNLTLYQANKKDNPKTSSLLIRRIALNLCEKYGEKTSMYHSTKEIKFGYKSSIYSDNDVEVWLDNMDASKVFGYDWQSNINKIFDTLLSGISSNYQIQFAMLQSPLNATHIKIIRK